MSNNISVRLNPYLSNLVVLFTKFHELHWFVKGKMFVQVHQYTESRYEDFTGKLDEVAEKVIMNGEKPVSTLKEYLELATVKELGKKEYNDAEVLDVVLGDIKLLRDQAVELRKSFAEEDNFSVVTMLEDHIVGYEKEIWFLESMVK